MQDFIHFDLSIGLPPRWIDASTVIIAGPPNDGYSPNIAITRENLDFMMTSAEYAAEQLSALQQGLAEQNYKVLEESELKLADLNAFRRVHKFEVAEDDVRVTQLQIYVVKGREALTITCTNLSEWFDRSTDTFMDAIRLFRWADA